MFAGFSTYWQADSRPTPFEWQRDLRANGYRPRAFHQSVAAQRAPTASDCDGHPAAVLNGVPSDRGDAVRHDWSRKDGQGGVFHIVGDSA